jgi:hypothetical protein
VVILSLANSELFPLQEHVPDLYTPKLNPFRLKPLNFLFKIFSSSDQEFLATDSEVPGSIPGAIRFSENYWAWNGVHSAS